MWHLTLKNLNDGNISREKYGAHDFHFTLTASHLLSHVDVDDDREIQWGEGEVVVLEEKRIVMK